MNDAPVDLNDVPAEMRLLAVLITHEIAAMLVGEPVEPRGILARIETHVGNMRIYHADLLQDVQARLQTLESKVETLTARTHAHCDLDLELKGRMDANIFIIREISSALAHIRAAIKTLPTDDSTREAGR